MKTRSYLILMAGALLVPVLLFSWIGLERLLDWERESRIRGVQETARATALALDREVAAAEAALRVLAHTDALHDRDFGRLYEIMRTATRADDTWTVLADETGRPLLNTLVPYGTVLPSASGAWVSRVLAADRAVVSDLFVGALSQRPAVSVDLPVRLDDGRRYVLSQIFHARHFERAFDPTLPRTWLLAISGRDGVTIERSVRREQFVGKPLRPEVLQASARKRSGVLRHLSREGIDIYDIYTHSALTGWKVAVGVPANEIDHAARHAVQYLALTGATLFALAVFGSILLARRMTGTLERAAAAAPALVRGRQPDMARSRVHEVDVLLGALREAGRDLAQESASRQRLEQERENLLHSERQARRQAEAENKAKDDFLAMLGHELRNPLNAVSGALAVLETAQDKPALAARARAIGRRQVEHLARILDDLLDVGRIMAGKIALRRQRLDLAQVARLCVDSAREADHGQHVWEIDARAAWVEGDPTRLEQIVGNLLGNAMKYTPAGGRIGVEVAPADGGATLRVRDTGIGIAPGLLPRVFDIFVQGPTTLDRSRGGLGLGLALVRQLALLHGGTVVADSAGEGQGSVFTLRLPLAAAAEAPQPPAALPAAAPGGLRVLLVEDNDDGREMLADMLTLHGCTVRKTADAEAALREAAAWTPDVAVLDIGLPGMSGYELAERLRAQPHLSGVLLIALTGYGMQADRARAAQAGFAVHLTKPVTLTALLAAMAGAGAPAGG